jgi:NAD(P)-dependent dehydrogenase (short-subunit alcohol dehydrogenase family)
VAEAVVREIRQAGGSALAIHADTSREDDVERLFDTAQKELGPIKGLANNAGMNGGAAPLVDLPVAELRRLIDINVVGAMRCAREAVRRMATDRGGSRGAIVNLGSVAAVLGSPGDRVH